MDIVGGFDVHRKQITFDYIEMDSGEVHREARSAPRTGRASAPGWSTSVSSSPSMKRP